MKTSLGTLAKLSITFCLLNGIAFADFREHYDLGQNYMSQYQYSGAITEFKSALRINYLDNSARISLVNAYLSRGTEYANKDKNWAKAADDFRSALFYLQYFANNSQVQNSASTIVKIQNNLDNCLNFSKYDMSSQNRFNTAKRLRAEGNFPAAAYEFMQALGDRNLQKNSFEQVGDIMKLLGNNPKAAEYYKKAIAVAPTDLNLRLTYARILDGMNTSDDALNEYSYVLQRINSENKEILYSLERTFKKKLQDSPNNANLNANMGVILQKEGRLDEALSYYKQAETLDPSNINTRINTGTLHQQKGDYKTAIKAYESVLILHPNDVNANLYRAQCYDKLGESKIAQEGFKKVLALDPNNSYIKTQMVENAKKTMTPEQFVEYVKTNLAEMNPAGVLYDYAIELHKNGKIANAIDMYNSAIKLNEKEPEMYVNLSLAQAQDNKFENALSTLKLAKSKFPENATIQSTYKNILGMKTDDLMNKAAEAYNNSDYKTAINFYSKVSPASADSLLGIASSYQNLDEKDKAIEYYKKALTLKPVDSNIAYYIACLYGEKEDYTMAKDYLQKALIFDKDNVQAKEYLTSIEEADKSKLLNEAITLYDNENYENSILKLNELLAKEPDNSYALYYRGMIYDIKQQNKEAITDLTKAFEINKDFTICNYLIATNYDTLGNYKDAYKYYMAYANSEVQDDEYKQYARARVEELKDYAK